MKNEELLKKIKKMIDDNSEEMKMVDLQKKKFKDFIKWQVQEVAPFVKAYSTAKIQYDKSPSIYNGSRKAQVKQEAAIGLKSMDVAVENQFKMRFNTYVTKAEVRQYVLEAIHEQGLSVFEIEEIIKFR